MTRISMWTGRLINHSKPRLTSAYLLWQRLGWVRRSLKLLMILIVLVFLVKAVAGNWEDLRDYRWSINYALMAVSFVLTFPASFLTVCGWHVILSKLGASLTLRQNIPIWTLSQLARYVPGTVWYAFGRVYLCRQQGVPVAATSVALLLELVFLVASALLVIVLSLPFVVGSGVGSYLWVLVLTAPVWLVVLHPRLLERGVEAVSQWFGPGRPVPAISLTYRDSLGILLIYVAQWVVLGVAFYFLAASVTEAKPADVVALTAIHTTGWVVGFLAFFAPSGLGVREGVLIYLLGFIFSPPVAVALSLLSRLWATAGELGWVAVSLIWVGTITRPRGSESARK